MEQGLITAVGIDVSKGKSMVAVRRPGGRIILPPVQVNHTAEELAGLAERLSGLEGNIRIIMEHTGMYWRPIAHALKEAGFFVSVVNAILIHNFSDNSLRKVKTDKADALKIANYGLTFWTELRDFSDEDETRQMLKMQCRLYERTQKASVELRNGLISLLDQTFPEINEILPANYCTKRGHYKWVDLSKRFWQENICQGGFHHKNEIPPVKLGLVSQNKVYHIYPTQQSVKNGPPNRVPSRITNYHCQSAAKCDTCPYCFFDSFSFLFIHVYVSSPKFRFIELTRAKYTTNANDIQPSFIGVDSTGKQGKSEAKRS